LEEAQERHSVSLAEGLSRRAPFDEAKATARRALEGARQAGEVAIVARANWLLGATATELDPPAVTEAIEAYRGTAAMAQQLGMRPLVAHSHLGLGTLYRRTGNPQEAQDHLTTATTMYREMDMQFWLDQAAVEAGGRA
jgi:tetratricopeptide (TPR) repeat protein